MRFSRLLLTAAGLVAAAAALAQQPAAEAPAAQEPRGLQDLEDTVGELLDEEAQPTAPERETPRLRETEAFDLGQPDPLSPRETEPGPDQPAQAEPQPAPAEAAPAPAEPETPAAAPSPRPLPPPLTRAELAAIERVAERGRLLIAIARAGIIATEDMLTRISDPEGAGITGWIAEPEGNAMGVTFYALADGDPRAVYRATVNGARVVAREVFLGADRPELNPLQARMAAARTVAEGLDHRPCGGQGFNFLVMRPATADGPIDVYQTTPPSSRARFPLGGHFRSTIAADGSVVESRGFTNACVDIDSPPVAAGAEVRPIGVTHLLDPTPTEIHVFLAQMVGRPLLVATGAPQRLWLVTPERIVEARP